MVVQLSKKHSDTILAFAQLGPTYMSPNCVEGERECKLFFPKNYDEPEPEEVEPEIKKKSKKKAKKVPILTSLEEEKPKPTEEGEQPFIEGEEAGEGKDFSPEMAEDDEDVESLAEFEEGEEFGVEEMPEELDKATSPMGDETNEGPTPSDVASVRTDVTETTEATESLPPPPPPVEEPPSTTEQEVVADPPPTQE